MTRWMTRVLLGLAVASLSFGAHAVLILGPGDAVATSSDNTNYSNWAALETGFGIDMDQEFNLAYKAEVGDETDPATVEEGPWASSYETTFFNTPLDPEDAVIRWIMDPAIDCQLAGCFLVVKDGKRDPAQYLFDISDWDGVMDIEIRGFWTDQGAISNVAIWVPEPSTLALLGVGLLGLGFARRRKSG